MAAAQQAPDRTDTVDIVDKSSIDVQENSVVGNMKQAFSTKNEETILSHDANDVDLLRNAPSQLGPLEAAGNQSDVYPPNIYAPQAQTVFYGGYESTGAEWEQYVNVEGMGVGSTGIYNENPSLVYHTGYGYNPQMPYGPYSPVATPLPNSSGDGQLYSPQHFPFTGQYYQQPATPSMYITSPTSVSQADLTAPVVQQGAFLAGNSNSNGMVFGSRPGYHLSYDSFGRGSSGGNSGNPGFYDLRQGFDVSRSGGYWSDWSKIPDGGGSLSPLSSPAASSHPISVVGSFGQNNMPLASGMASQQQRSFYGFGSLANSYNRGYSRSGMYQRGTSSGMSFPSLGNNSRSLNMFDKGRRQAKADASLCSCNGPTDFLTEQNRGPRATRPKKLTVENMASTDEKTEKSTSGPDRELYNKPDFAIEYEDAKFFIIKSYSEDNVHKSIKYGVWASTANGNRKLDSAYREAKERGHPCPIFLFFSVNASAQFCGVAEMIGPVDFEKSVDYWQQDKWSGQFPVKWHIVKDVSNNMLRHIILENNDNKPVTNSRDTQEVKLEQGLEMLSIFKQQESDLSILDDFDFYEERQKAMQERKALQHQQWTPPPSGVQFVDHLSTSFADSVRLEEINILGPATEATFTEPATDRPEKADSPDSTVTESS